jgi:hypothetical protein
MSTAKLRNRRRQTIGHAIVAAEHGAKVLAKGGLPSVALIGDIKDKNHRDKVRTEFNDRYAKGGGGCAILPSGLILLFRLFCCA